MFNYSVSPDQASTFAGPHDLIFWALTGLTLIFTLIVYVLVIVFAVRYRRGTKVNRTRPVHENLPVEVTWSVIPLILGLIMFWFGAVHFINTRTVPRDAMEVFVIGKQWMWHVQHSNGVRENNTLHVPVGKPVKLTMISQDVVHAFYVPDFRIQYHVVPGRYTTQWFQATKPGKYPIFCGMYCGTQHSEMGGYVYVMEPTEFAEWLKNGGNRVPQLSMEERGERLYKVLACDSCHKGQDTLEGPTLNGIFNRPRQLEGGQVAVADQAYLREAILRPHERLTAGYTNTMPQYEGQISEEDTLDLIAYLRVLGGAAAGNQASGQQPQTGAVNRTATGTGAQSATGAGATSGNSGATERRTQGQ